MPLARFLLRTVLTLLLTLLLTLPSTVMAAEVALTGKGEASYTKKKDAMKAREDAIEDAIKKAVQKSLSKYVTPDVLAAKADEIEVFLETAVAMVKRYEVVKEDDEKGTYSVILKAYVDEETLKGNLDSSGFSMDVGSRRTIAVLIDEYFAADAKPSNEPLVAEEITLNTVDTSRSSSHDQQNDVSESASSNSGSSSTEQAAARRGNEAAAYRADSSTSASEQSQFADKSSESKKESESFSSVNLSIKRYFPPEALRQPRSDPSSAAAITKRLLERDARMADAKVVSDMRQQFVGADGLFMTGIADPSASARKAMELGAKYASDAVMLGVTAIVYNGEKNGAHSATATLVIRIVDTVTGDIVATAVRSQSGSGTDSQTAASEAGRRLGDLLGQDLGEQLFSYWKKRDEKGIEVTVRIVGVTSTPVKLAASDILSAVKGVEGVEERVFDRANGLLEFVVTTRRPLKDFKSDLLRGLYAHDDFKKLEEEMSMGANVNLKLEP